MAGYPKTKAAKQIARRPATSLNNHSQLQSAAQENSSLETENTGLAKAEPQTVLRALQAGKLSSRQRGEAVARLSDVYGNQAIQRIVSATKTNQATPALLRTPAVAEAPAVPASKTKYEDFRDEAVRAKYLSKLKSEHVKDQLTPEFKRPKGISDAQFAALKAQHVLKHQDKRKQNEFKLLGLGGWHLGGIHQSADGHEKVVDKKGKVHIQEAAEANLFDKSGQWHFGTSPDEVIEFFNDIVKVKVPGNLYMHKKAAERLENVYAILQKRGKIWPETSVGQSFRGNIEHAESTASYHSHKLGFALDFRAAANPMLTNGLKRHLLKAVGGGSSNINLNRGGQTGHRAAIREMGKLAGQTIAENQKKTKAGEKVDVENVTHLAQVDNFFTLREFDKEYDRVKEVSDNFVGSLTEAVITELKGLRETYIGMLQEPDFQAAAALKAQISKAEKGKKKNPAAAAAAKTALAPIEAQLTVKTAKMRERIKTLLAPWIKAVQTQRELAANLYKQEQLAQSKQQEQEAAQQKQLDLDYNKKLEEAQKQIAEAKAAGKKSKVKLPTKPKAAKGKDKAAKQAAKSLQEKKDELDYWIWLQDTLETKTYKDLDFVLEKSSTKSVEVEIQVEPEDEDEVDSDSSDEPTPAQPETKNSKGKKAASAAPQTRKEKRKVESGVVNPSVLQLATRGFFNPDTEKSKGKTGKNSGFDKDFVKLMLMHGFAWGATWGSQDTMHFELAEGVDNLPSSLRKYNNRVD